MSFGVSIGDFVAVYDLGRKLYADVYKVARKAPEELGALEKELACFSQAISMLIDQLKDPDSLLSQSGPERIQMVVDVKNDAKETLDKLQNLSEKYGLMRVADRPKARRMLDRVKFAKDAPTIDSLRTKIARHYNIMQLILTSVNNSSLERFVVQNQEMEMQVRETRDLIVAMTKQNKQPTPQPGEGKFFGDEGDEMYSTLALDFLAQTEQIGHWMTIGLDAWLSAGRWWLVKSRIQIASYSSVDVVDHQGFTNLLKAYWISDEIVYNHPQRMHIQAAEHRRAIITLGTDIQRELRDIKASFKTLPSTEELQSTEKNIWSHESAAAQRLQKELSSAYSLTPARLSNTNVVLQGLGHYGTNQTAETECIVVVYFSPKKYSIQIVVLDDNSQFVTTDSRLEKLVPSDSTIDIRTLAFNEPRDEALFRLLCALDIHMSETFETLYDHSKSLDIEKMLGVYGLLIILLSLSPDYTQYILRDHTYEFTALKNLDLPRALKHLHTSITQVGGAHSKIAQSLDGVCTSVAEDFATMFRTSALTDYANYSPWLIWHGSDRPVADMIYNVLRLLFQVKKDLWLWEDIRCANTTAAKVLTQRIILSSFSFCKSVSAFELHLGKSWDESTLEREPKINLDMNYVQRLQLHHFEWLESIEKQRARDYWWFLLSRRAELCADYKEILTHSEYCMYIKKVFEAIEKDDEAQQWLAERPNQEELYTAIKGAYVFQ